MFHRTQRLLLRPAWLEDAEGIFAGIGEQAVVRNLARAPWPYTLESARAFIARNADDGLPRFLITLPSAQGSEIVGMVGLDRRDSDFVLGYWVARRRWGQGIATEAVRGMIEVASNIGIERITAGHFCDNPASGRVLRKAGFKPTGEVRPQFSLGRGEEALCVQYALDLTAPEFSPVLEAA